MGRLPLRVAITSATTLLAGPLAAQPIAPVAPAPNGTAPYGPPALQLPSPPPPPSTSPAAPPSPATPGQPATPADMSAWQDAYLKARERLIAGDFDAAAEQFDLLARTAPNSTYQVLALEQARLAGLWRNRGLVLVRRSDLGESNLSAKAADERTTDEISVLYSNSVLYGLGTGGWFAVIAEPDSAAGVILPALGLAGASAGLVYALDSHKPFRYGVPESIVAGFHLGFYEGLTWTLWNQAKSDHADEWKAKTVTTVIWGMSTVGAVTGGVLGSLSGTTPGRASFVESTGMWSAAVLGLTVAAFSPDDSKRDDRALLASAIALNAGVVGGALAAGPISPTIARVRYLDLGGICGALLVSGLYVAAKSDDTTEGGAYTSLSAGMLGGLAVAWFATVGMPPDRRERDATPAPRPAAAFRPTVLPSSSGTVLGLMGAF